MRLLIFILASFLLMSSSLRHDGRWIIDTHSKLYIYGSTNVNNFICAMDCYNSSDTLVYREDTKACQLVFQDNTMTIPVESFNCGSKLITKDFLETLNAKRYPNLDIKFLTLEKFNSKGIVTGNVEITLAGVKKQYAIQYKMLEGSTNSIRLTGKQPVCFSDFDLKAPQKLMGLIQVQENLDVEFRIILKPI